MSYEAVDGRTLRRQAPSLLPSTHVFKYHVKIHHEIVGDPTTR